LASVIRKFKKEMSETAPKHATRKSSELTLNVINPVMQETVGGSADLSGSNNTKSKDMTVFDIDNGGGDERYGVAWRHASLWRNIHVLYRLRAPLDALGGLDENANRIRDDA
jgi:transketolase